MITTVLSSVVSALARVLATASPSAATPCPDSRDKSSSLPCTMLANMAFSWNQSSWSSQCHLSQPCTMLANTAFSWNQSSWSSQCHLSQLCTMLTHKRFKRPLFIRTKHNMRICGVIRLLCFVLINSVLLNLLCVWILFQNAGSRSCFRFLRHAGKHGRQL